MVLKNKKIFISCVIFAIATAFTFAIPVPELKSRINDYGEVLDASVEEKLSNYSARLEEQTGIQLAVLTVPTIEDESIEDFSMRVADEWKLGEKGKDNGILITLALAERKIRIEVGYGLEGVLTDAQSGLIIRNAIIPEFKEGDYDEGISAGVSNIVGLILNDEELYDKHVLDDNDVGVEVFFLFFIIWIIFMVLIFVAKSKSRSGSSGSGPVAAAIFFDTISDISRSSGSGSGSGGFGGFSGGGGGFGGGGASGGW